MRRGLRQSLREYRSPLSMGHVFYLTYQRQFIDQSGRPGILFDDEQNITDIDADRTLQPGFERDIPAHRLPVTVECKAYQLTFAVKHGTAGITAGNVVIAQETHTHGTFFGILAEILGTVQLLPSDSTYPPWQSHRPG